MLSLSKTPADCEINNRAVDVSLRQTLLRNHGPPLSRTSRSPPGESSVTPTAVPSTRAQKRISIEESARRSLSILGRIWTISSGCRERESRHFGAYEILASHNSENDGGTARPAENPVRIREHCLCPDTVLTEPSLPSTLTVRMSVCEEVVCR